VIVRIGTRGSALALWQANHVKARLESLGASVELQIIKTRGDKILDVPLAKVGGKGLFVKEIEEALLRREVDLAVHSMKDVPAELEPGLVLAAVSRREDPRDVIVSRSGGGLVDLPRGANVGTSSVRRICQLHARRSDLRLTPLRGNVDTRLRKLDTGELDAIVLAAAGLVRLGHEDRISERLDVKTCLPAIGQGVLGLETRAGDLDTIDLVRRALHDAESAVCVEAERAFLSRLEGGCQTPIACHAVIERETLRVDGLVGDLDGKEIIRDSLRAPLVRAYAAGVELADRLLARGAKEILERCRSLDAIGGA
jgi:hydroxymethylbilane synthase